MPFVPFDDRPISIDGGSREVRLPHETGVSLTMRDHENEYKRVTMAELMTETNYLNPDVEVIAEINTPESFETFAETLNTGRNDNVPAQFRITSLAVDAVCRASWGTIVSDSSKGAVVSGRTL